MSKMASKPVKKTKRKANGYQMPGHIPKGEILEDTAKNQWIIDTSIGVGGFGEIYSAHKASDKSSSNYVVKIEPSENGPLFCERTVYLRIGKKEDVEEYMKLRKLKSIGMPRFYGFGTQNIRGTKYRFLVMERYGKDLWSIFLENNRLFPTDTVYEIGNQILDVLEYLHVKSYVHADIKGANLLLGRNKETENQIYLVDFGLACKYASEFKPNPKKAHNGTLEYASRDAHLGVATRRGDVEILGYNMAQWLSSRLPWESLKIPSAVESEKIRLMKDYKDFMKTCFEDKESDDSLSKYFKRLCEMKPLDAPDYDELRKIFADGIKKTESSSIKLEFGSQSCETSKPAKSIKLNNETTQPVIKKVEKNTEKRQIKNTVKKRSWKDFPTIVNGAKALPNL